MRIGDDGQSVTVTALQYSWTYERADDHFSLRDSQGRPLISGPAQAAVVVAAGGSAQLRLGTLEAVTTTADQVRLEYSDCSGGGRVIATWRFEPDRCWFEPVEFQASEAVDVVRMLWFARPEHAEDTRAPTSSEPRPGLVSRYLVHPGVAGSAVVSPVILTGSRLDLTTWLGRGGGERSSTRQQWGLPVHYLVAMGSEVHPVEQGAFTRHLSDAVCLGLADLPAGDLFLRQHDGRFSPLLELRGDLWGHFRGPGTWSLGAPWVFALGSDVRDAVRSYQKALVDVGRVRVQRAGTAKAVTLTASQFNTWGAQLAAGQALDRFDQSGLATIQEQANSAALAWDLFVVDAKWEGQYGELEHDVTRFPGFEQTLDSLRSGGRAIGLWAALLRCDDPATLGLEPDDLLRGRDGSPLLLGPPAEAPYGILDVTRPAVRAVLRGRIAKFVEKYRPSLVKFDFGYEIPDLSVCAPADLSYAGERLLGLALEVAVGALRSVDPDIAIMYYSLTPLFAGLVDLHGVDDPWMGAGEFHAEIGRRLWFAGLLGELGVPACGSGGYDWTHQIDIWFDSVVHGPLGALGSFSGDLSDSSFTPRHAAVYRGLSRIRRRTTVFRVDPLGTTILGAATAARSSSWSRSENGQITLAALRPHDHLGAPGAAQVPGVLTTTAQVVVASMSAMGLTSAVRLGIVPFGRGELELTLHGDSALITTHTLSGLKQVGHIPVTRGVLTIQLLTHLLGDEVTWIEVELSRR